MGTYELSGHENGKPTWSSLTATIYMSKFNQWLIRETKHRDDNYFNAWDIGSFNAIWPTQRKAQWKFFIRDEWTPIEEDISVKCTGNTIIIASDHP